MKTRLRALVLLSFILCLAGSLASAQTAFRFVAWGDSRDDATNVNTAVLSSLSNQANALSPIFTLFTGDLCTSFDTTCTATDSTGWKYAIDDGGVNGMFDITFATRGNHDTGSPKAWQRFFDMKAVASRIAGTADFTQLVADETYSFDYGNSHFVSIDVPGDVNLITTREIRWLDTDLSAAETRGITHTFIFWHGPIYCVDGHCSYTAATGSDAPPKLISVINKHPSITASFHGHEHVNTYTHLDDSRIPGLTHPFEQFVTGGAGAPLYNCDNTNRYDYCRAEFGFVTVDVNGSTVTISQYLKDKSRPDESWTFTKTP